MITTTGSNTCWAHPKSWFLGCSHGGKDSTAGFNWIIPHCKKTKLDPSREPQRSLHSPSSCQPSFVRMSLDCRNETTLPGMRAHNFHHSDSNLTNWGHILQILVLWLQATMNVRILANKPHISYPVPAELIKSVPNWMTSAALSCNQHRMDYIWRILQVHYIILHYHSGLMAIITYGRFFHLSHWNPWVPIQSLAPSPWWNAHEQSGRENPKNQRSCLIGGMARHRNEGITVRLSDWAILHNMSYCYTSIGTFSALRWSVYLTHARVPQKYVQAPAACSGFMRFTRSSCLTSARRTSSCEATSIQLGAWKAVESRARMLVFHASAAVLIINPVSVDDFDSITHWSCIGCLARAKQCGQCRGTVALNLPPPRT